VNDFERRVADSDEACLHASALDVLQVNLGLRCNMTCAHCHQSCSPTRTEIMDGETIDLVIDAVDMVRPHLVDITGGAPELHPDIRTLLGSLYERFQPVQLRTNLTALLEPEAEGLIGLMASQGVSLLASLHDITNTWDYEPSETALAALRLLSEAGYGHERLRLDVAVCPKEAVPTALDELEERVRASLEGRLGIPFTELIVLTNVPVGRFREHLVHTGELDTYQTELGDEFNAATLPHLWCRTGMEIGWDGSLADCDYNLAAGMTTDPGTPQHVRDFDATALATRRIRYTQHCLVCAASAGSG
jgi:radical SAM/Cys-rich protein